MNPEYKSSYGYESDHKEDYSFSGHGISLKQALVIEKAKQDGVLSRDQSYALASLIDQGIL